MRDKHATAGITIFSDAGVDGENVPGRKLHNHELISIDDSGQVFGCSPGILAELRGLPCPYPAHTDEVVPETLGSMFTRACYG